MQILLTWIFFLSISLNGALVASTTLNVFENHLNPVLIETGTYFGDGIAMALQVGFKEVHSIELSPYFFKLSSDRFKGNPAVHLYQGDSSVKLKEVLKNIDQRATFWLDGHFSEGITAKGATRSPILQELAAIAEHPIKNHTILIDDIRQLGTIHFDYVELIDLVEALMKINPDYRLSFEDGFVPNDILVAEIL
jgi:hypothetical protein